MQTRTKYDYSGAGFVILGLMVGIASKFIKHLFKNTNLTELTASVRAGNKGFTTILEKEMYFDNEIKNADKSEQIYKFRKKTRTTMAPV